MVWEDLASNYFSSEMAPSGFQFHKKKNNLNEILVLHDTCKLGN